MGDTVSLNGIMSEDATKECEEHFKQPKSLITVTNKFYNSADTKLTKLVLYNLTRNPHGK